MNCQYEHGNSLRLYLFHQIYLLYLYYCPCKYVLNFICFQLKLVLSLIKRLFSSWEIILIQYIYFEDNRLSCFNKSLSCVTQVLYILNKSRCLILKASSFSSSSFIINKYQRFTLQKNRKSILRVFLLKSTILKERIFLLVISELISWIKIETESFEARVKLCRTLFFLIRVPIFTIRY